MEDSLPASHNVDVPNIVRTEYALMGIDEDGFTSLMNTTTNELRSDIKLPEDTDEDKELCVKMKAAVEDGKSLLVTVLSAIKIEKITEMKEV